MELELMTMTRSARRLGLVVALFVCSAAAPAAPAAAVPVGVPSVGAAPAATAPDDGEALREAASLAIHWGDFAEAERLYKAVRERPRRTTKGQPESTPLRLGLEAGLKPSRGMAVRQSEQTVALTAQWVQQHPQSPLAHLLHVTAWVDLAFSYRGTGYANTVPQQAWTLFRGAIDKASAHASQHADVLLSDSMGFRRVLLLARFADVDAPRVQALYEQAVERFPEDDSLHFAQLTNVLPKWSGSARLVDQHIESVVRRTPAARKLSLYALLYTAAAEDQFEHALFTDSMARWPRMDQGYAELTAQYPHPQHFNAWAWMACQAQDRQRLLELLEKVGPEPDLRQWGSNARQTHDTCKAWAQKL